MNDLISFFEYAIRNNNVVEWYKEKGAVFSGDDPIVVARRIFSDFPYDLVDKENWRRSDYFCNYLLSKSEGYASIVQGTHLFPPG